MTVANGDIIQVVLNATGVSGQDIKNVFTWLVNKVSLGTYTEAEIATIGADAVEEVFNTVMGDITSSMTYDTVDVYKRLLGEWDYQSTGLVALAPQNANEVLPAGNATLATANTAVNRVRGRKFIYGITEQSVVSGTLSAPALSNLADFALEYITAFFGSIQGPIDNLVPGVYSLAVEEFRPFGAVAIVKDTISYQRRRKPGVGS